MEEEAWLLLHATNQAVVSTNTSTNPIKAFKSLLTSKVVAKLRRFLDCEEMPNNSFFLLLPSSTTLIFFSCWSS